MKIQEPAKAAPVIEGEVTVLDETLRTYKFPVGTVEIHDVVELIVRPSGTHRLRDAAGKLHVIRSNWIAIEIVDKSEQWTK
tara:strand:+ start:54563 stop:54805 length:243 start_codon:yes stop_codon:yes gene_type:complete